MLMRLLRRVHYWLHRRRHEAELAEEMAFHRSLTTGAAFGNLTLAREEARAVWIAHWLESVWQDARYAIRALSRQPGFALLAIGALTAGIGLNASLFAVYTALAMKPWAVRAPEEIVRVINNSSFDLRKRAGGGPGGFSRAEVDYFRAHAKTFAGFAFTGRTLTVRTGDADAPAHWVDANYFVLLGVEMALGAGFVAADRFDVPQASAVISHGYWQRRFGGDPAILGREIRLDDVPFTIAGVASRDFPGTLPERIDIWLPLSSAPLLRPDDRWVRGVLMPPAACCTPLAARLAPGATAEQAASELNVLSRQFRGERPGDRGGLRLAGTQLLAGPRAGDGVFAPLFVGLVLVLLLACANVGNLLLARGAARRREIAVRLSLGASRGRIVRQLLTEGFVLAGISGIAGLLIAAWLPPRIVALAAGRPTALRLEPDVAVLAFTVGICVLSCLLFGLAPALQGTRHGTINALKQGSALPGARFSLRTMLLAVQVAAVVVLLAAAGVLVRSARAVSDRVLAGAARDLSVVSIAAPVRGYDAARIRALAMEIEQALEPAAASGAVAGVALTSTPPLASGNIKGGFRLPGSDEDEFNAVFEVSPSYFGLMRLDIVEGRAFQPSDRGRSVIVVNETMARRHWPGRSAVGQRIVCTPPESGYNIPGELEIVGVVRDSYMTSLEDIEPTIFQPTTYRALPSVLADTRAAADAAVAAVARIDPRLRVRVDPLAASLVPRLHSARVGAIIAGALGFLALAFACVGMFGVFAYWVRQRTQEIGVRMALGAQSSDVMRLVIGTTARAVVAGLVLGLAGSIAGASLLRAYLFGLSGIDPPTYVGVALILVAASLVAAFLPVRRATRIDPLVALRYE